MSITNLTTTKLPPIKIYSIGFYTLVYSSVPWTEVVMSIIPPYIWIELNSFPKLTWIKIKFMIEITSKYDFYLQ